MKVKLTDEVATVLRGSDINANSVVLKGQLDRKLYQSVNDVLVAAGGKWDKRAKAHVFPSDPREALGLALETGSVVDKVKEKKKTLQTFYTPREVAMRAVALLSPAKEHLILEPSCGEGAMLDALKEVGVDTTRVYCFDVDAEALAVAERKHSCVAKAQDFLTVDLNPYFDRVLMNPPFAKGQDIKHVRHAYKFLNPGGRLVAIMSPSWQSNENKAAREFREFVRDADGVTIDLPEGSFKESGTMVSTVMLVLNK